MKTLIIGVGNPIAGEDSFGIAVATRIEEVLGNREDIFVDYCIESGIRLAEKIIGYDRVIIIDAIRTREKYGSKIVVLNIDEWNDIVFKSPLSAHDIDFLTALKIMKSSFEDALPKEILVVGYVLSRDLSFTDKVPANFYNYVNEAVEMILDMVGCNAIKN